MPLIIVTGYPSSGKSTRCKEFVKYAEEAHTKPVHIICEEDLKFDKNSIYKDSTKEKNVRADLKASVLRTLSRDEIVVLDSLNYIKGYRYELYCATKSANTTHCVIHCATSKETCAQWNKDRNKQDQYTTDVLDSLIMRYETPNPATRWDTPLFVVHPDDPLPSQSLWDALYGRRAPSANLSTLSQPLSTTNFLYDLDKITQDIVANVVEGQKFAAAGDSISIHGATEKLRLSRLLTPMELQRYRRQFITYTKTHPVSDSLAVPTLFIKYLQGLVS